jgi:pyruvate formate lyase activating enzyme
VKVKCSICHHQCKLSDGQLGLCRARRNFGGEIRAENYGRVTSIALDPIEKKPLYLYRPGTSILSVGSYGCNMRCAFCQNCSISMTSSEETRWVDITPEELVKRAKSLESFGNIGIAYTYNEPFVGYEFVMDCAKLACRFGLANVVVTNGCILHEPLVEMLPFIDAMNIDLKSFSEDFYKRMGGDLDTVLNTIATASQHCHVEVTTLVIPGENDTEEEMLELSAWVASIDKNIALHISRFFPAWKMSDKPPTPVERIYSLAETARKHLRNVYVGNV